MTAAAEIPRPAAALLPLQDRAGEAAVAMLVSEALVESLAQVTELIDPVRVRDTMRRLRVRSAMDVRPARLETLFRDLGAPWLMVPILHSTGARPIPHVSVSAIVLHAGSHQVTWAGFRAASGLDNRRLLGRGVELDIQDVAARAARELIQDFVSESLIGSSPVACPTAHKRDKDGYLRHPLTPDNLGLVAVVPFDAITGVGAAFHAETLTAIAYAELYRHGIRLALPALVGETLRQRRNMSQGELDQTSRIALRIAGDIDTVFTGTVEKFELRGGLEPEPEVSCSSRFIDAEEGQILSYNGMDESGWDGERLFLTGRTYTRGHLAEQLLHAMLTGALQPPPPPKHEQGPTS